VPKTKFITVNDPESLAEALDLEPAEAQEWRLQHALLSRLLRIVRTEGITHAELAERAGTSRTRVTAILNGQTLHVSSDMLVRLLAALGYRVKVSVSREKAVA